jgi:uncharacterized membrane protein
MSITNQRPNIPLVEVHNGQLVSSDARKVGTWLKEHWLLPATLLVAAYAGLPWLAPIFMEIGWTKAANVIYLFYATQCHQLPQRSFFLFGDRAMYSLAEIQSGGKVGLNPLELRQFIGNSEMGWKVAWSDRMVAMYTSIVLWVLILFGMWRKRVRPLPLWGLILLLVPMILDGVSHMISDLVGGVGSGFRDSNVWLTNLTNNAFASSFYSGDALGSFNSWMRFLTGILFGLAIVWFIVPRIKRNVNYE